MKTLTLTVGPVMRTTHSGTEEVDLLTTDAVATRHMEATARMEFARRAKRIPIIWPTVKAKWTKRLLIISGEVARPEVLE